MEFREFSAKTVDEAITKASLEFETFSENLEIEVISEGKSGFLGFGAKPAIIKVRKREASEQLETPVEEEKKEEAAAQEIPKTARKETVKEQKRGAIKEPKKRLKRKLKEK